MNLVFDQRDKTLEVGYQVMLDAPALSNRVSFTLDEFKDGAEGMEAWGISDGDIIGMILIHGNHPHIVISKEYHNKCGFVIKKALNLLLKKHRKLVTEIYWTNTKAIKLAEKLGFKFLSNKNKILTYSIGE